MRFLDDVIDVNRYPLDEIAEMTRGNRKIGLGVMGFADMLIQLGIPYDSEDGISVAEQVMSFISNEGKKVSCELAAERGVFPKFKGSVYDRKDGMEIRNATVTTIAPTGTLSIIASCSSGIEPLFAISYVKRVMDGAELMEVNPHFEKIARDREFYSDELMREIAEHGSVRGMAEVPEDVQRVFATALDIAPVWHVRMQAAFQRFTDNAVSKTVNFPEDATPEDVRQVYELAYREGCKGCTIYRYGSRDAQVLERSRARTRRASVEPAPGAVRGPRPRPSRTRGVTERINTGCGNMYITINEDENGLCEVFAAMGKAGGCAPSQLEAIGRLDFAEPARGGRPGLDSKAHQGHSLPFARVGQRRRGDVAARTPSGSRSSTISRSARRASPPTRYPSPTTSWTSCSARAPTAARRSSTNPAAWYAGSAGSASADRIAGGNWVTWTSERSAAGMPRQEDYDMDVGSAGERNPRRFTLQKMLTRCPPCWYNQSVTSAPL